ncbi:MAG: endonuclease III [Nitrospinae bacterium]|nr:endonuclease III [Nitrospinota bacterium]
MKEGKRAGFDIGKAVAILRREVKRWKTPIVTEYSQSSPHPAFHVLISCLLSLRTKDEQTAAASRGLFAVADTPEKMRTLPVEKIEKLIYPVGFYRVKARTIIEVCGAIMERFGGEVPSEIDELLTLKGVGRKTANLVATLGFNKPGICVDTHVHRICNIWGYVKTKTPDKTEFALREKLPERYWIEFNDLLVTFGQNLCKPVSPICSQCKLDTMCPKIGVGKRR